MQFSCTVFVCSHVILPWRAVRIVATKLEEPYLPRATILLTGRTLLSSQLVCLSDNCYLSRLGGEWLAPELYVLCGGTQALTQSDYSSLQYATAFADLYSEQLAWRSFGSLLHCLDASQART